VTPQQQGKIARTLRELADALTDAGDPAPVSEPASLHRGQTEASKEEREWAEFASSYMHGGG